jgi:hypothetical protein
MKFLSSHVCLALALVIGVCGFAYAADAAPDSPQSLAALWPMFGTALSTAAGYGLPRLSAHYTFFHTTAGAFVIGIIGAAIGGVIPVFQGGSVTWAALAWAALSGFSAFCARLNPSSTKDDPPAKSPNARPGATSAADILKNGIVKS